MHTRLLDSVHPVTALAPVTPTAASPRWVSLKDAARLTILISVKNGATVTGSAIALSQATDVAGTGAKALALTKAWRCLDAAAGDALAEFAVSGNTFTTDATNAKDLVYAIDVLPEDLDTEGRFDCLRVTAGNGANMTLGAMYLFSGLRHGGDVAGHVSKIVD